LNRSRGKKKPHLPYSLKKKTQGRRGGRRLVFFGRTEKRTLIRGRGNAMETKKVEEKRDMESWKENRL